MSKRVATPPHRVSDVGTTVARRVCVGRGVRVALTDLIGVFVFLVVGDAWRLTSVGASVGIINI